MIDKKMILLDLVEKYPNTENYFRTINEEKCILCYNLFDSLEDIADEFSLDISKFVKDIESHV